MFKLTSFTSHTTGEGERISYTYSRIEDGEIVESNIRKSILAEGNSEIMDAVYTIRNFLNSRL